MSDLAAWRKLLAAGYAVSTSVVHDFTNDNNGGGRSIIFGGGRERLADSGSTTLFSE